jgi:16S rRNA (guanine1207-N2)-methyltransferase
VDTSNLLIECLRNSAGGSLLVADENCIGFPFALLPDSTVVISNRIDICREAEAVNCQAYFSDYDFSVIGENALDRVAYRISKEKAVVHHVANEARRVLKPGGQFILVGAKQEGIKTFAKTIGQHFNCNASTEKHGQFYRVHLTNHADHGPPLDDNNYNQLREIYSLNDRPVYSKPGQFGWNKKDAGSELLVAYLPTFIDALAQPPQRILDLGCGYGFLSLAAASLCDAKITATDNCAAAIASCRKNFEDQQINGQVIADNCGETLTSRFDVILSNPPFHQGFENERNQTEKFVENCRRLLEPAGSALFVVNVFVPLEKLAAQAFSSIETVVNNSRFKLVVLTKPR